MSQDKPREIDVFNSFKRCAKKHFLHLISHEWSQVLQCLLHRQSLPEKYQDHALQGNLGGFRDCHVKNDLVLIYKISDDDQVLELHYLDTHAEVFKNAGGR